MKKPLYLILYFLSFFQSCVFFDEKEGKNVKINNNYSILFFSSGNQLMYKSDPSMNGAAVILRNIDSIGWDNENILIYTQGKYNLIFQADGEKISFSDSNISVISRYIKTPINLKHVSQLFEIKK